MASPKSAPTAPRTIPLRLMCEYIKGALDAPELAFAAVKLLTRLRYGKARAIDMVAQPVGPPKELWLLPEFWKGAGIIRDTEDYELVVTHATYFEWLRDYSRKARKASSWSGRNGHHFLVVCDDGVQDLLPPEPAQPQLSQDNDGTWDALRSAATQSQAAIGGRYDWEALQYECAIRLDQNGAPERGEVAAFVKGLSDWYRDRFDKEPPDDRTLRRYVNRWMKARERAM